jgi:2-(1,2-epoxy-1,2-dihydrophenyl)acetyl-CoA isomerase
LRWPKGSRLGKPVSMGLIKRQLEDAWSAPVAASLEREAAAQSEAFAASDLREGAAAFIEKRAPAFSGS